MSQNKKNALKEIQLKLLQEQFCSLMKVYPDYTVSNIAEQWLLREKMVVKESTYAKYRYNLDNHILPQLGTLQITELNSALINMYIQHLKEGGRSDGRGGLSAKYVRDLYTILRGIIHYAELEYNFPNAAKNCRMPPKEETKNRILSKGEQKKLESFVKADIKDRKKFGILLGLYTGLRLGEICALQWRDIDLQEGLINVSRTIQRIQNPNREETPRTLLIISSPKSRSSVRSIPLPSFLQRNIKELECPEKDTAYFLTNQPDQVIEPRNYQYHFKRYMKELDMEQVHFHTLRHTFATRGIESGMDMKSLSEILGHTDINITMNTYVHSSLEEKRRQIEKICL
ncbi:MAG: tyrosine-type recombinase/integrase [Lachnospiraceae bacterium]|nr:tyrosine-type recombinase/integrase [Lachnospiraceae bacterium]